jgi:CheY-like chemotaxis protein
MMVRLTSALMGVHATWARSRAQAVALTACTRFDVVVIDAAAAPGDRHGLVRGLRAARGGTTNVLAIVEDGADARAFQDAGAEEVLRSPFQTEQLFQALQRLGRPAPRRVPVLRLAFLREG